MFLPNLDDLLREENWLELRDSALTPQFLTELVTTEQSRAEFVEGARLLRLDQNGKHVFGHQLLIADMLNAGHETNGLIVPRRSAKTTSILAVALGRCTVREDYLSAITLTTTAAKTADRFTMDVVSPITRTFPDKNTRPLKIALGRGSEHLSWTNGSVFAVATPNGDAFRSSAYDFVIVDEAGEARPEQGVDLKAAIFPTFDTRPGAQVVFAGTAGEYQEGLLLWDALQEGVGGRLGYVFPADVTEDELADWEPTEANPYGRVRELTELSHPGLHAGLTTLDKLAQRYITLGPAKYAREYGGIFGQVGQGVGVINQQRWAEASTDATPALPEHFSIAAVSSFTGAFSAIVAAWRDEQGRAHGYVLKHQPGTTWLAEKAPEIVTAHDLPLVYDSASSTMRVEVEVMGRSALSPWFAPQQFKDVTDSAALLVKDINNGNAVHYNQEPLNQAAKIAVRRKAGATSWALGRPPKDDEADICALEAWSLALNYFDNNPKHQSFFIPAAF
ncbi:hypothetical protein [Microbacterium hominis]|uniref:Terminase n=1 Tax=Microbacterium hominis TaxID=162426 RepID=A0A0B4E075_9MICO|nr:hypothetical protein [Microbacterium hominis]KIC59953.1 hypothetical protein RM52_00590 [Microbacterium hominis]